MRLLFAPLLALLLVGCESVGVPAKLGRDATAYPNAPYGVTVMPNLPAIPDTGIRYTAQEVRVAVHQRTGAWATTKDNTYAPLSEAYLIEHEALLTARLAALLGDSYVPESGDCEDGARIARQMIASLFAQSGIKASPLVPVIEVDQRNEFARVIGIPTGRHALIAFTTDKGDYVLESLSARDGKLVFTKAENYPNFAHIKTVEY